MRSRTFWFFGTLLAYALGCRLLPYVLAHAGMPLDPRHSWYPWNFSPLMATCLLCGAGVRASRWAFVLPLTVVAASDFGIGWLTGRWDWAFPRSQAAVYLSFALGVGMGRWLRSQPHWSTALPAGFAAEVVFFVVTNFAVWWFSNGNPYPPNAAGLATCYVAAIPFFGRSLISTLLFVGVLFSPPVLRSAGITPVKPQLVSATATA